MKRESSLAKTANLNTVAGGVLILLACTWLSASYAQPAGDLTGAFSVSENWTVTIAEDNGETPTFSKTYHGTATGTLTMTNGNYTLIDKTGLSLVFETHGLDTNRVIYGGSGGYEIDGDYPVAAFAGNYAIVQLSYFMVAVKLPVNDFAIPVLSGGGNDIYTTTGSSLASLSGAGDETDENTGFTASAYSTSSLTGIVPPNKLTLSITSPTSGQRWSNALFNVTGATSDNVSVRNVYYSLNGSAWATALTANNWVNWNVWVMLNPGTNTIAAYAVDTSGNLSTTSHVSLVYVLSAPISLIVVGQGTVGGAANGQLFEIGKTVTLTATPAAGYVLTNWLVTVDGATILSTNRAVPFLMQSNLVLTATFVDVQKPVLTITAPVANQRWSNTLFTVMGTASDNVGVSSVSYSLNSGAWTSAATGNNWTNWTAAVNLIAGTNTVRAYAVDTSSNDSLTNSVKLLYVLSATLTVRTNGQGGITPAYNNVTLQIGNTYSMTAKPDKGFGFVNWTDGLGNVITNGATLKFIMASNLTCVANFVDIIKPTLTITNPMKIGEKWSNAVFTVSGKASDNVAVSNVWVSLNGASWTSATLFNHGSNWTKQVTLIPGTNSIAAYAVDTSGNFSLTNTVKLDYILSAPLTVQLVGEGTLTPNYNGQLLAIGTTYTMKAVGTNGCAFYYWSGGVPMSANSTLTFTMASNLTIIANFKDVRPPGTTIAFPTRNQKWSNSVITITGKASDNVGVAKVWVQINDGGWFAAGTLNAFTNWSAANLPVSFGTNIVQACAVDAAGNVSLTNEIKFIGVLAPTSLAGYAATIKVSGQSRTIIMSWGDDTWAVTGTGSDTDVHYYDAGSYTYNQTGPDTAVTTNVNVGMMSALGTTNVTTFNLSFTSASGGNCAWSNENGSGSGTMTLSRVSNLVPASLAGHTLHIYQGNGAVIGVITLDSDGTFTISKPNGGTYYGTYTFTQYSPTVAILQLNHTDPGEAGALENIELTFTSATAGQAFGSYYGNPTYGSNPDDIGLGTFQLK